MCQGGRTLREKPLGELQPVKTPDEPWDIFTIDFITGLPENCVYGRTYNAILVVMNVFSKMAHYIPYRNEINAGELVELILREIIRFHGIPLVFISDRGSLFTSRLWANLMYILKVKRRLSTAFHPQTDGQMERQNRSLEQYLRNYVNYEQDDWAPLLPLAKFAYNSATHSSTEMIPFEVNHHRIPWSNIITIEEAKTFAFQGGSVEGEDLTAEIL